LGVTIPSPKSLLSAINFSSPEPTLKTVAALLEYQHKLTLGLKGLGLGKTLYLWG
jgi:hypothetical protein